MMLYYTGITLPQITCSNSTISSIIQLSIEDAEKHDSKKGDIKPNMTADAGKPLRAKQRLHPNDHIHQRNKEDILVEVWPKKRFESNNHLGWWDK